MTSSTAPTITSQQPITAEQQTSMPFDSDVTDIDECDVIADGVGACDEVGRLARE